VNWKEIDTMDFSHSTPDSFEEIAKVFVCDLKAGKQGIFQDVSAIMSIFSNMNIFNIDDHFLLQFIIQTPPRVCCKICLCSIAMESRIKSCIP
jgi:hypothetical protein